MSGAAGAGPAQNPNLIEYRGDQGPGLGKHVVLLAGDHEYRSEETLPALARILARRYGFRCSVLVTTDPKTGFIEPGSSNIQGLDLLRTADLLIVFLRFQDFPDAEMRHVVDYLDRGGPVIGLRTATHAFQIQRPDAPFLKYTWKGVEGYPGGFGRQILGETWVSHYGTNHKQSSSLVLDPAQASHPILRGVKDVWVESGGYTADPMPGSVVLARGRILNGMTPNSPPADGQAGVARGLDANLSRRLWSRGPCVHDNPRRVRGSSQRRIPPDARERRPVGRRPRVCDSAVE